MDNNVQQSVQQPSRRSPLEYQLKPDDRLCYIHIPKTAGTTFTSVLDARFNQEEICPAQLWADLVKLPKEQLANYRLLRGHFPYYVHQLLPQQPVYVTMLRDPLERVISAYEFARRWPSMRSHQKATTLTLEEFVADPEMFAVRNSQTRHFLSQLFTTEIDLKDWQWVEEAKAHLEQFAFVGITERFQQSMALLSYTFGWPLANEFQNLMVTPRKFKREELSQDAIASVLAHNQLDVELYDYASKLFERRYSEMLENLNTRYPQSQEPGERFEQHYQQRYAALNYPQRETVTFQFNQPLWGTGWHLREGSPEDGLVFRWMGPGTTATLDLPLKRDRSLAIELRVVNSITSDVLESLRLTANQHEVPLFALHRDKTVMILRGTIPAIALESDAPFTRLTFHVDRTLSYQKLDSHNPDNRPISVAFDLIQIFPLEQQAIASLIGDPFENKSYQETAAFVEAHIKPEESVLAPNAFSLKLSNWMGYLLPKPTQKTGQYAISPENLDQFQWVIVSKALPEEIGLLLIKLQSQNFLPVYANEVFVVFTNRSDLAALNFQTPHVKSLYINQLKFAFNQQVNSLGKKLYLAARSVKRFGMGFFPKDSQQ